MASSAKVTTIRFPIPIGCDIDRLWRQMTEAFPNVELKRQGIAGVSGTIEAPDEIADLIGEWLLGKGFKGIIVDQS